MKDTMVKIFKSLGLEAEAKHYLHLFKQSKPHKFAVIKISGHTLSEKMSILVDDLTFLSKLGLCPIVIHGGGKPIDEELSKKGIKITKIDGIRITDKETIKVVEKTLNQISNKLVESINKKGGKAINANKLSLIELMKKPPINGIDLGFVGDVKNIKTEKILDLCKSGYIPVFASLGHVDGISYNINADTLANEIVKKIHPRKFILITSSGGILDIEGEIISVIDIQTDLLALIKQKVITEGMLLKVKEIKELLEEAPETVVEICSAENLLKELFTSKGSGTFVRYGGNFIIKKSFKGLNLKNIKKLLEESFGKVLVDNYFKEKIDLVILEKDYNSIAIIKKIYGKPYLDKFAVSKSAQGNGLGKTIWYYIKKHYKSLIWRSSVNNIINSWYFKNSDGSQKNGNWIVFWYNLDYHAALELIPTVSNLPETLVKL